MIPESRVNWRRDWDQRAIRFASSSRTWESVRSKPEDSFQPFQHPDPLAVPFLRVSSKPNRNRHRLRHENRGRRFNLLSGTLSYQKSEKIRTHLRVAHDGLHRLNIRPAGQGFEARVRVPFTQIIETGVILASSRKELFQIGL